MPASASRVKWADLVRPAAAADGPTITVLAIHDPRHREPRDCYRDRWPVEQLPLAAKQVLGAARQFVHAPETCQRLPALALLAGAVLSYAAATAPAIPTGFWDRRPQPGPCTIQAPKAAGRLVALDLRRSVGHEFRLPSASLAARSRP
jgi:hypothetical protein